MTNGLYYFTQVLQYTVPAFYREMEQALAATYPTLSSSLPSFIRFGTWIGGDRDGNPLVTADVAWAAVKRQAVTAVDMYLKLLDDLYIIRSESEKSVPVCRTEPQHPGVTGTGRRGLPSRRAQSQ